jgi:hypothetical protein
LTIRQQELFTLPRSLPPLIRPAAVRTSTVKKSTAAGTSKCDWTANSKRLNNWHCRPSLHDAIFPGVSITATVEKGKIVLPANVQWPSGTVVRIEPVGDQLPTLWETLKDFDGMANDLPADLADNVDH